MSLKSLRNSTISSLFHFMIVALGVDYSIFLMMLYRELDGNATEMILDGARHIGGTFAALIPSGVITLIEVAMTVILGLFLIKICYVTNFYTSIVEGSG